MNIGITGGHGFFGSHFVTLLRNHRHTIALFDRKKHSLDDPSTMKRFVEGKDAIVHFAGVSKLHTKRQIQNVNVKGTKNVCKAILDYSPKTKLIFISSFQVYSPNDIFGKSKKEGEEIISDLKQSKGLMSSVLRFSNVYGPDCPPFQHSVISTFIEIVKTGMPVTLVNNGKQKRDFLYVKDACEAIYLSLTKIIDEPLDICTGKKVSLSTIVRLLEDFTKRKITVYNKPLAETNNYSVRRSYTKAWKIIGWKPKTTIEQGLQNILKHERMI